MPVPERSEGLAWFLRKEAKRLAKTMTKGVIGLKHLLEIFLFSLYVFLYCL